MAAVQAVISSIRGYCLGGAFELAMACDFSFADTHRTRDYAAADEGRSCLGTLFWMVVVVVSVVIVLMVI